IAQREHEPIGSGVQDEAHLIGERRAAAGAVGGELTLVHLDQVLGLAARTIEGVVYVLGRTGGEADRTHVRRGPYLRGGGGGRTRKRAHRRLCALDGRLQSAGGTGTFHPSSLWCAGQTHQPDRPVSTVGDDVSDRRGSHARGDVVAAARGTAGARALREW